MNWRCLNDFMGYCNEKPECDTQPDIVEDRYKSGTHYFIGGTCKLNPATCGKYQTATEHYAGLEAPPSKYRHTIVKNNEKEKASA